MISATLFSGLPETGPSITPDRSSVLEIRVAPIKQAL